MKKIAMFILMLVVSIAFVNNVCALSYTSSSMYFEYNSSKNVKLTTPEHWYSTITASQKTNNPIVNTKAQNRILFIWNQGANYDIVINQTDYPFPITWTQTQEYYTSITWKQTNSSASMMVVFKVFD